MPYTRRTVLWILLACLAAGGIVAAGEFLRRRALYWYDVRQDYDYRFSAAAPSVPVEVGKDGFELPSHLLTSDLTVLEVRVAATLAGWWFEPCLEVVLGDVHEQQCFERGARGRRYVLLPQAGSPSANVRMLGRHLAWEPQVGKLLAFAAPHLAGRRILVLAPHPDDAEIAAFGLYAAHHSFVATITAGNYVDGLYGRLGVSADVQDELRGEMRVWDSLVVPQLGGVAQERTVNLGYGTYTLKALHAARNGTPPALNVSAIGRYRQGAVSGLLAGRTATPSWSSLVADLVTLLEAVRPDVIVSPHPAIDDHTDHQYTTLALLEALEARSDRTTTLLLYTNHHPLAEHYPFGPATALITLPPWFGEVPFAGLMSRRLDATAQMRKLFALEAMHDLRAPPERVVNDEPSLVLLQRLRQAGELVRRDPFGDYSYFRRAVRPNELFFVYPPEARAAIQLAPSRSHER